MIVREGSSSLGKELLRVSGEDPDGDEITFGVLGTLGLYILRVENVPKSNSAIIYLNQELDRETRDTYNVLLTLTDGKLGKGNYVSWIPTFMPINYICHFSVSATLCFPFPFLVVFVHFPTKSSHRKIYIHVTSRVWNCA